MGGSGGGVGRAGGVVAQAGRGVGRAGGGAGRLWRESSKEELRRRLRRCGDEASADRCGNGLPGAWRAALQKASQAAAAAKADVSPSAWRCSNGLPGTWRGEDASLGAWRCGNGSLATSAGRGRLPRRLALRQQLPSKFNKASSKASQEKN